MLQSLYLWGNNQSYPFLVRLGGTQNRSGRNGEKESLSLYWENESGLGASLCLLSYVCVLGGTMTMLWPADLHYFDRTAAQYSALNSGNAFGSRTAQSTS